MSNLRNISTEAISLILPAETKKAALRCNIEEADGI